MQTCDVCGLRYDQLRTGLTYRAVYRMLWVGSSDYKLWRYKRRRTVLGLWHAIKLTMWVEHLRCCEEMERADEVPF